MKKRLSLSYVKESFVNNGYILLSENYVNSKTKLTYICPDGCKGSMNWNNWSLGKRCPCYCKTVKKTYKEIRKSFEQDNYVLLSTSYINSKSKLSYRCPNNHFHDTTLNVWNLGKRCPSCYGNTKPKIKFIKSQFEKENYKLISTEYINNSSKLYFICPQGHQHYITWDGWNIRKQRCGRCKGNIKITYEKVKKEFESEGYQLLSTEYIKANIRLDYICSSGHKYNLTWNDWQQGSRCLKCSNNGTSKFEQEVKDFLINLGQDIIENDRSLINNPNTDHMLELDILFPCKTKAIECNGVYWHDRPEVKVRDEIKQKRCKELGIDLLVITDEEWNSDQNIKDKLIKFSSQ